MNCQQCQELLDNLLVAEPNEAEHAALVERLRDQWVDQQCHDDPACPPALTITFELRRIWDGHVEYSSEVETTLFDYRTTQTTFTIGPRDKVEYPATVVERFGVNKTQSAIDLK